jgi:hypothetical protein
VFQVLCDYTKQKSFVPGSPPPVWDHSEITRIEMLRLLVESMRESASVKEVNNASSWLYNNKYISIEDEALAKENNSAFFGPLSNPLAEATETIAATLNAGISSLDRTAPTEPNPSDGAGPSSKEKEMVFSRPFPFLFPFQMKRRGTRWPSTIRRIRFSMISSVKRGYTRIKSSCYRLCSFR